ncbi:Elongation factor 2 [Linum grandiflorum]
MERLWGENFFDPATKKWTTKTTGFATCKCVFVQFCYEPIKQIINICMTDQKDKLKRNSPKRKLPSICNKSREVGGGGGGGGSGGGGSEE